MFFFKRDVNSIIKQFTNTIAELDKLYDKEIGKVVKYKKKLNDAETEAVRALKIQTKLEALIGD